MASPEAEVDPALVVGCGYLGKRVAQAWRQSGRQVAALTRSRMAELQAEGLTPIQGDVLFADSLGALPRASTLLLAVGMDYTSGRSMREVYVAGLENVLKALPGAKKVISISSTSVYGQTDGSWVEETDPTEPVESSGETILEAERLLRSYRPDAIILRFAGIYGPGRLLRRNPILNGQPLVGDAEKWLNLIHVEDGVQGVLLAEERGQPGETYNIADDSPVSRRDFYTLLAELLQAPPARFEPDPPGSELKMVANRRVRNQRARQELGFSPRYPSYVEGLRQAVASSGS